MDREKVMQLWNSGYSKDEIVDETGYDLYEVSRIIRDLSQEE